VNGKEENSSLSGFYPRIWPLDISDIHHIMLIANAAPVDSGLQLDISAQALLSSHHSKKMLPHPSLLAGSKIYFTKNKQNIFWISHLLCSENALYKGREKNQGDRFYIYMSTFTFTFSV
jgi:hypothetical protein